MKNIFDFLDYKAYLGYRERLLPARGRGFRAQVAKISGCTTSYVSLVLTKNAHFSLEQAMSINKLLDHDAIESEFFINLVEFNRAGTRELKDYFRKHLERIIQSQLDLKKRIPTTDQFTESQKARYYSDWYYVAIHVLLSVPKYDTTHDVAEYLQLPVNTVNRVIKFLSECNLVEIKEGGRILRKKGWIHLDKESPNITKHHTNWRMKAVQTFERQTDQELHYTSVISISEEDVLKLKSIFVKSVDQYNEVVKPSKEETVYCLCLDFFRVGVDDTGTG